jgi:hypothetical protein
MQEKPNDLDKIHGWGTLIGALILAVTVVLSLSGCSLQKRLDKYCPLCTVKETRIDSIGPPEITREMYDSLIAINDRMGIDQEYSNCDSLEAALLKSNGIIQTLSNGVKTTVQGGNGKPIRFKCATDSLLALLTLERQKSLQKHYVTITKEVRVDCNTWWDRLWIKVGKAAAFITGAAILIAGLIWFLKRTIRV